MLAAAGRTVLPKKEHDTTEWRAAMEALLLALERGGPTMFARIGTIRALNRHHVPEFNPKEKGRTGAGASSRGINDRLRIRKHRQIGRRRRPHQGLCDGRRRPVADLLLNLLIMQNRKHTPEAAQLSGAHLSSVLNSHSNPGRLNSKKNEKRRDGRREDRIGIASS